MERRAKLASGKTLVAVRQLYFLGTFVDLLFCAWLLRNSSIFSFTSSVTSKSDLIAMMMSLAFASAILG